MWEQGKSKYANVIMDLKYEDFAELIIEKRIPKGSTLAVYELRIMIFEDILEEKWTYHQMKDLESVLVYVKKEIEELYNQIPLFDNDKLNDWLDRFIDKVNEF